MSYLVFTDEEAFDVWIADVNEQMGLPNEHAATYTNKMAHPTPGDGRCACLFLAGGDVEQPENALLVEQDYMRQQGWFSGNG